jgi:uncharacterized protein DUF6766
MRRLFRQNGLSLVLTALFLVILVGHSVAGHRENNEDRREHGQAALGFAAYLRSGHFLESVFENWESEFFQMGFYVFLTAFLRQKGSAESKKLQGEGEDEVAEDPRRAAADPRAPGPVRRGGWILKIYEHSLSLAFLVFFLASFALHAVTGLALYNEDRTAHGQHVTSLGDYVGGSRFWFESLQNWQSEFLAVLAIVVLSIFLREKGSPESKPVAAPHDQTGGG